MQLIGSETSPYVRKVRVYLAETALPCDFVVVDAWKPAADFLKIAPIGKVPVLIRDNDEPLSDSNLILEYLDSTRPPSERLIPVDGQSRWEALRLLALANGMIDATAARTVESRKPAAQQSSVVLDREFGRIERLVVTFEARTRPGQFLAGGKMSIADLTLAVALQYLDFRHTPEWRKMASRLAEWLTPYAQRPAFKSTLPPGFPQIT